MLMCDEIMDLNSDLSLMNIGDSSVNDNTLVKEQHSKYRRRSFLKLEPTIFEDFATIHISDNSAVVDVKSKCKRKTVSKKRPLPTEIKSLEYQDYSVMNMTCVDFGEIKTNDEAQQKLICTNLLSTPITSNCGDFSSESTMENSMNVTNIDEDEKCSADVTCSDISLLVVNSEEGTIKKEQVKSKRRRKGSIKISPPLTEDIMEDEELSVMNVTCGVFSVSDMLDESDGGTKENVAEKPKLRRSLRKKIQPLNTSTEVLGSSQVSTSHENFSDIEQYYLCKKYKRLPNSLETIFEEPMQKNNKSLYISTRKFNRTIKFGGNSASANLSKIKKRITKASKLVSSKKFLKRRKVSMNNLLKALSTVEELE